MARPKQENQIPDLAKAILTTAWQQISEKGAAALNLRGIARRIGITAPAIYNYYPSRDDLVTALIVKAFSSLAESQREVYEENQQLDIAQQIIQLGLAYRSWAIKYPQRYQLIFGTPLPDYQAPVEITYPAAASALIPLVQTFQTAVLSGSIRQTALPPEPEGLHDMLMNWSQQVGDVAGDALYLALVSWTHVHGLVSLEIGDQLPVFITNPRQILERDLKMLVSQILTD